MGSIFYLLLLVQIIQAAIRAASVSSTSNGSISNLAHAPVSKDLIGPNLSQSVKADEATMIPLIKRLRSLEKAAVDLDIIDPAIIQPKIIHNWSDLMTRVEHLYFMLGGNDRVLADSADKIELQTFLQVESGDWKSEVDKFLADDYFSDIDPRASSDQKKSSQKKTSKKLREATFLMTDDAEVSTTTEAPVTSGNSTMPTYSEIEDALNVRESAKLSAATRDVPSNGDNELDALLEKEGLRATESLVDDEEAQDSQVVDEVSRDILTNQGVMQSDVPASPEDDTILTALLAAANEEGSAENVR